ncbi:PEP-CTERM sorting domain-containing protein [Thalassomonas haliotis]|uniref:PEP-CTERM sorting domain-containing protein n=2 Tax=Thalassomonas haliotis TaxID=485448 RepID=A0ABY7VLE5_9GAMM|nr:PEP-CTERM sorting domain-containing protein [Thalassomonas haliotis]
MDFGITNQYSYYQVSSMLDAGETFAGWRIASEDDVFSLFINAFHDDADTWVDRGSQSPAPLSAFANHHDEITGLYKSSNFDNTLDAMSFNQDSSQTTYEMYYSVGLFKSNSGALGGLYINDYENDPERRDGLSLYTTWNVDGGVQINGYSTLLVRDTSSPGTEVPEPSTLAILALGALGLSFRRFKKN